MRELRIFIDELSGLSFFFLIDFFLINIIENDTFIFLVFDAFVFRMSYEVKEIS